MTFFADKSSKNGKKQAKSARWFVFEKIVEHC